MTNTFRLILLFSLAALSACGSTLPRVGVYGNPNERTAVAWNQVPQQNADDVLLELRTHEDPETRARAKRAEAGLQTLETQRAIEFSFLINEEFESLDLADVLQSTEQNRRALRNALVAYARDTQAQGKLLESTRAARAAIAIERSMPDAHTIREEVGMAQAVLTRAALLLELVAIERPQLAHALRFGLEPPEETTERPRKISQTTTRQAITVAELLLERHASDPSRTVLQRAAINQLREACALLAAFDTEEARLFLDELDQADKAALIASTTERFFWSVDRLRRWNAPHVLSKEFVMTALVEGMAAALDRNTTVVWPKAYARFMRHRGVAYHGLGTGLEVRPDDRILFRPIAGGPARQAGIRRGDQLVAFNGVQISEIGLEDFVTAVTNPRKGAVELHIVRKSDGTEEDVTVQLGSVHRPHVSGWQPRAGAWNLDQPNWRWLADTEMRIAYIRLDGFRPNGARALRLALREAQQESAMAGGRLEGLILDLRANGGGRVDIAREVANLFMPNGTIIHSTDGEKPQERQRARRKYAELAGMPLVVLVDERSASASELVAGLLQSSGAALVVGDRTFGKGSMQTGLRAWTSDCMVLVTTGWYQVPSDGLGWRDVDRARVPEQWGITPNVIVSMTADETDRALTQRARWYSGDGLDVPPTTMVETAIDPTLDMAIALLRARILELATN